MGKEGEPVTTHKKPKSNSNAIINPQESFLYAEENILSERFARIGKVFYFVPSVSVLHRHGETIGARYDARRRSLLQFDSMGYYYSAYKSYPRWSVALARKLFSLILRTR